MKYIRVYVCTQNFYLIVLNAYENFTRIKIKLLPTNNVYYVILLNNF